MNSDNQPLDLFIIGGGINGTGIARDAAGRGFSVCLAEMNDLASGTSSISSKLIHGGLRYLEYYEFRLVREALTEREVLWAIAPHIVWPVRIVLPYHKDLRPFWLLRLGLFIYDYLGGRKKLPTAKTLNLKSHNTGAPLKSGYKKAFEYSDCAVLDSRLTVLNAMDAREHGAEILTRTKVISAVREGDLWNIKTVDENTGAEKKHCAKMIVNAAGPWIDQVLGEAFEPKGKNSKNVRLVQGSHIVVNKLYDHDRAYIFQNADERIIFVIPFEEDFTMIGTTDFDFDGKASDAKISESEIDYLCEAASEYFENPIVKSDVVWNFSGVRSLYDDGADKAQEATRDYVLRVDGEENEAPLLNIFGGKITTYRRLAESALEVVESKLQRSNKKWTGQKCLPGGDFPVDDFDAKIDELNSEFSFLTSKQARRLVRCYGTKAWDILCGVTSVLEMGQHFGGDLYECEVRYLVENEWAIKADDILFRRTKQGLHFTKSQIVALAKYLK